MPEQLSAKNPNSPQVKPVLLASPVVQQSEPLATKPLYAPINGKEARQILTRSVTEQINTKLPLFKEGLAFHNIHMMWSLVVTCTPTDCPVPQTEFEKVISAPGFENNKDWTKAENAIKQLEVKRKQLIKSIGEIDNILNVINPVFEIEGDLDASKSQTGADELRLEHGLPLPREVSRVQPDGSIKKTEELIQVDKSSVVIK